MLDKVVILLVAATVAYVFLVLVAVKVEKGLEERMVIRHKVELEWLRMELRAYVRDYTAEFMMRIEQVRRELEGSDEN